MLPSMTRHNWIWLIPTSLRFRWSEGTIHYGDVIMGAIASQITSLTIVYSTVYADADQRKHHSLALLALCAGNSPGPMISPHKWPVTRKMFPFDDVIVMLSDTCRWKLFSTKLSLVQYIYFKQNFVLFQTTSFQCHQSWTYQLYFISCDRLFIPWVSAKRLKTDVGLRLFFHASSYSVTPLSLEAAKQSSWA